MPDSEFVATIAPCTTCGMHSVLDDRARCHGCRRYADGYRIAQERRLEAIERAAAGGLTHAEIAEELGVTRSAVSQMLRAARRRTPVSRS